jgi:hypothetical protein
MKKIMLRKFYQDSLVLLLLLVSTLFIKCDRTPVGYDELGREISEPIFNNFRPVNHFCYGKYIPLGAADYLVLGRNTEYESRILLQFPIDTVTTTGITGIKLILYPKRFSTVSFTLHLINKESEWVENTTTWDRAYEGQPWTTNGGDYHSQVLQSATLTSDSCIIPISATSSLLDSLQNYSNGIILIPTSTNDSFATINSKSVSSKAPRLVFEYSSTKRNFTPSQDCHIINAINLAPQPYIDYWIGAGYPFRTMLKFNLDTIPSYVTIAYAELVLPIQSQYSFSDSIDVGVRQILKILNPGFSQFDSIAVNIWVPATRIVSTDTIIVFDIRKAVQFWITKPDSNFGIQVSGYPENYEINRIKFKTGNIGPYLKIGYILPPKGRFGQ